MSVENVYQNIESILQRIDAIKKRFSTGPTHSFKQVLQSAIEDEGDAARITETAEPLGPSVGSAEESEAGMYETTIKAAAERFSIPSALIRAVIKQESDFDSQAVSHKGAMGLMQLMPETAELLGVDNPFDPDENIFGGTRYLVDLINLYEGNLNKALAAYNAGPQRVKTQVPNIPETQGFVDAVLHHYERYSKTTDKEGF
jgi:soluble lytic murein transglycosylase-like protein